MRGKTAWYGFVAALSAACTAGSSSSPSDCADADKIVAYDDSDGDGYGGSEAGEVCALTDGQVEVGGDCNDADPNTYPLATEACDGLDNNCDNVIDEFIARQEWFVDADGDGFGTQIGSERSCERPEGSFVEAAGDCNDDDQLINPGAVEVCDGIDNDCDSLLDDADEVDPSSQNTYYRDDDFDGYGVLADVISACFPPNPRYVDVAGDCNDEQPNANPSALEVCDGLDNDCDTLVDDEDDSISPASQTEFFVDNDLDGFGNPSEFTLACTDIPGAVTNDDDCNDDNPDATLLQLWYNDIDSDGVGGPGALGLFCESPFEGAAPESAGSDCDDNDPVRYPGATDVCEDGIDQDCSGADSPCANWLYTVRESDNTLRRWDLLSGTWQDIGPLGTAFDFGDLAYDESTGTFYMIDGRGVQGLHTVDLATGAATLIGIHGITDLFGLTLDTSTNTLYASAFSPPGLYAMDVGTGVANFVGNPGLNLDGIAYDATRDQVVGITAGPGDLWVVNRSNGALSFLSNYGFVNNCGLAYAPTADLYYAIDWSGVIYSWDPNAGYSRTIVSNTGIPHDGFVYIPDPPN